MDLSVIFQLRTKKFWWMDVIFYFVMSLLIATVLCYFIFMFKNGMIRQQIKDEATSLQGVGTLQQKQHETEVMSYQKKINDFTVLLKNHEFASNVFAFMQAQTMPNIWFSQFSLDEKNGAVQLNGESDNLDAFSRQVASLEQNKYVKNIGTFNSSLGQSARTEFNIGLVLDSSIFNYLSDIASAQNSATSEQSATTTTPLVITNTAPPSTKQPAVTLINNGQKLITSFHILLDPEVIGQVDQTTHIITLTVPHDTDIKNLTPAIVVSPGTTVAPASLLPQDFTEPVTYSVIASDNSAQNYQVKVILAPPVAVDQKNNKSSNSKIIIILGLVVVAVVIILLVALFLIRGRNKKNMNGIPRK